MSTLSTFAILSSILQIDMSTCPVDELEDDMAEVHTRMLVEDVEDAHPQHEHVTAHLYIYIVYICRSIHIHQVYMFIYMLILNMNIGWQAHSLYRM